MGFSWIGTEDGIASWDGVKLARYPAMDGRRVSAIVEDHEGTIWVGTNSPGWLCSIRDRNTRCSGQDGSLGRGIQSAYEDRAGKLWAATDLGLWRWKPARPSSMTCRSPPFEACGRRRWNTSDLDQRCLKQIVGDKVVPDRMAGIASPGVIQLLRDREGGIWAGTVGQGLVHLHRDRTDVFLRSDGLSGDAVVKVFEDREGNIWPATDEGLDRFQELPVYTVTSKQGLTSSTVWSALAARDGSVWVADRGRFESIEGWNCQAFRQVGRTGR